MSTLTTTSLTATNLAWAMLEAAYKLQIAETALTVNPNLVTINLNDDTRLVTITASLPALFGFDANGNVTVTATNYASVSIAPNGDIKSDNVSALLLEMAQKIIDAEDAALASDATFAVRALLTMDANTETIAFSTTIPYSVVLVSGKPTITAVDYLP